MSRSVPARCGSGSCLVLFEFCGELSGRQIAEARMRASLVVVAAAGFDDGLGLGAREEPFHAQALVAELAVEALTDAVLPWLARVDQGGLDALVDDPLQQRAGDELRAVVGAQVARRTTLADQRRQHFDDTARAQSAVDLDRQPLLGPLVGDGQALELLAIGTPVEDEVIRPHLVDASWRLRPRPTAADALARPPARNLQARPPPQSAGPSPAHSVALALQEDADAPVAEARVLRTHRRHTRQHRPILRSLRRQVAQRRTSHSQQRARPALRQPAAPCIRHLLATGPHAYHSF